MSDRSQKIDAIIDARKPIAEKTAEKIEQLNNVSDSIRRCANLIDAALRRQLTDEQRSILQTSQTELQHFVNEEIPKYVRDLRQLQQRFGRDTLNIGVVGNAGQGKSTLLQSLTGLQDEEIPTGNKGDCTGAAAIIENRNVPEAYADIEFYSESEFLSTVVAPYYRKLNLPQPSDLSDLAKPLPSDVKTQENFDEVKFIEERLQHGLDQYQRFLGRSSERITKDKIREYTAKSDANGNPLSIWAAVKSARVCCSFPGLKDEKISVGDTPGLGDRSVLEAEERLMKDFGRSIDAVIMMRRINVRGIRKQDVTVFNLIKQAIPEFAANKWSYFLVNVFKDDRSNPVAAEALKFLREDLRNSSLSGIQDYIEVDCSDKKTVLSEFDKILNSIAANQAALDQKIYDTRVASVASLLSAITEVAKNLSRVFPTANNAANQDYTTAQTMFGEDVWGYLAHKLKELVKERYEAERNNENPLFTSILKEIESKLIVADEKGNTRFFCLPSEIEFARKAAATGAMSAYDDYCQIIRRNAIKTFEQIDVGIESSNKGMKFLFDKLRDEVKQCFTSEDGGKFANVTFSSSTSDAKEVNVTDDTAVWLNSLADEITLLGDTDRSRGTAKQIAASLRQFAISMLRFREFILPRILPCFDVLNSSSDAHRPFLPASWEAPATTLITNIDAAAKRAVSDAIGKIREFAKEPSMALFATVEDVCDAVLRTDSEESSKSIWKNFAAEHRSEIFPDIFQQKEADTKFRKEWNEAAAKLQQSVNVAN